MSDTPVDFDDLFDDIDHGIGIESSKDAHRAFDALGKARTAVESLTVELAAARATVERVRALAEEMAEEASILNVSDILAALDGKDGGKQ